MKKLLSNKYIRYGLFLVTGIMAGWIFFHHPRESVETSHAHTQSEIATVWTCAMHPQIRMDEPGKCPICGMDLIPLDRTQSVSVDPQSIRLSDVAAQLANVKTSVVSSEKPIKEVRLYGKVQSDERLIQSQVSHIPGRIEKLLVNFTGETVLQGQPLAIIYSPELVNAQQELLEAAKMKQLQPEIYQAAREKLSLWKLTDSQIEGIESSGLVEDNIEILSNTSGVILARRVNNGDHVDQGSVLFDVSDLSEVWVMFDAYESDLPFIDRGDRVNFSIQALPGNEFSGRVIFIDPVIDPVTRVAKVRVEISNKSGRMKPGMFATGIINADLSEYSGKLIIPSSAVLWTGSRSIVYVKEPGQEDPVFKMREIELGPSLGAGYIVMSGLKDGEEIVTNGTFSVDASAQLQGKQSMMNPEAGSYSSGHQHDSQTAEMNNTSVLRTGNPKMGESGIVSGQKPENISQEFASQLGRALDQYLNLKNSLVNSDPGMANEATGDLKLALGKVDMKLLTGDAHMKWMEIQNNLNNDLKILLSAGDDLASQREAFIGLTERFYIAAKTFGFTARTVYYQFCPMYKDGKGGYWLSETDDIRNPYYGSEMLTCGETREVLKFQVP